MALCEGFSHIVLPVSDLDRSEAFYRDIFGLELIGRNLVAEERRNSLLKSDCRQMVVLVESDNVAIEREGANSTHHAWLLKTPNAKLDDDTKRLKKWVKKAMEKRAVAA